MSKNARSEKNRHRAARTPWPRRRKIIAAIIGASLAGSAAFAATNWMVGLNANSSSQAQSGSVQNITITASLATISGNLLFPGGTGDLAATITNPNNFPVTVTGVTLPSATTYGVGYSNVGLTTAQTGCDGTSSLVSYSFAGTAGSHTLTSPITVAAGATVNVTFLNDASMGLNSPTACQNTYFKMPSFTAVAATAGAATSSNPANNGWTA